MSLHRIILLLLGLLAAGFVAHGQEKTKPTGKHLPWLGTLAEGQVQAHRLQQPIFVKVGGASCPWCKRLDEEIVKRPVQEELVRWVLVAVDADTEGAETRTLGVTGIPALRVLTAAGRVIASQDGYLPEDKLIAWLKQHHAVAAAAPLAELTGKEPPTALGVVRLVGELKQRDPVLREAALRRLVPHADLAGAAVVEAFVKGPLQARLGALELLHLWKAPIAELDPWRPDTLTESRLKLLHAWAASPSKVPVEKLFALTDAQRAEARHEITRMLQAAEADALAARERLARFGAGLLPDVQARLKEAATDQARQRLTALRYRLVATDGLILNWPHGVDRLAAPAAATRHQAVQELAQRASEDEEPLLLELFSDPDPLVRELSLRALHQIAGPRAAEALTRLLRDPEPNVRAAVLKQLAEEPSAAMVPKLAEYVRTEKDADLVAHVARVLRASKGRASFEVLKELLQHESWRVRAEAAEAMQEIVSDRDGPDTQQDALRADVYAAFIGLLDDPDGFVVGRAMKGVQYSGLVAAVEPLLRVVARHPELAAEAVATVSYDSTMSRTAVGQLRALAAHSDPAVRAAAVRGVCNADPNAAEADLRAALRDPVSLVRVTAAEQIKGFCDLKMSTYVREEQHAPRRLNSEDPGGLRSFVTGLLGKKSPSPSKEELADADLWLIAFRAGKGRPLWWLSLIELLEPMLHAETPRERVAAAAALITLGREKPALPVLLATAQVHAEQRKHVPSLLSWLPWGQRVDLFLELSAWELSSDERGEIPRALNMFRDRRAIPLYWEMAKAEDLKGRVARLLMYSLQESYLQVPSHQWQKASAVDRKFAVREAKAHAQAGPTPRRMLALALLATLDKGAAEELTSKVLADASADPRLRRTALQIQLAYLPSREGVQAALATLTNSDRNFRTLGLRFLIHGGERMSELEDMELYLPVSNTNPFRPVPPGTENRDKLPMVPRGLTPELLLPLLKDADPKTAAQAGYLLALLEQPEGLPPLVAYWREHAKTDDDWQLLVARAITALGEDEYGRILEEIYRSIPRERGNYSRAREFYWAIRSLDGPNALRLRKVIRQEVGMENLR